MTASLFCGDWTTNVSNGHEWGAVLRFAKGGGRQENGGLKLDRGVAREWEGGFDGRVFETKGL